MAHIAYYGEDLQDTQEKTKMVLTLNQLIDHNLKLADSYIDLKTVGWKSYSEALNQYTFGFFSKQLKNMDESVENMAKEMKSVYRPLRGVCK